MLTTTHIAIALWFLAGILAIVCLGRWVAVRAGSVVDNQLDVLDQQAADHGEPTRAQVEAPWLADHSHIQPTPIAGGYLFRAPEFQVADPERAATVLFAAAVMADIDEWTGAAS